MFYTYVLMDESGELYTGLTRDLKRRLSEHNQNKSSATKGHRWHCIYYEGCLEYADARRREKYLKKTQGQRMLKLRLKEYFFKRRKPKFHYGV